MAFVGQIPQVEKMQLLNLRCLKAIFNKVILIFSWSDGPSDLWKTPSSGSTTTGTFSGTERQ